MDYYSILGLAPGASVVEVKRAYRRLSRRYHPGINPGDRQAEALFRGITEAYETLIDSQRRQQYDKGGSAPSAQSTQAFEFSGFDFSMKAHGAQAATFSELFAEALHPVAAVGRRQPLAGADLHAPLSLSFDESMRGVDREVAVTRQVGCGACRGAGVVRTTESKCPHCQGAGRLRWVRGHMVFTKPCSACDATGRERQRRCAACAGDGRTVRTDKITVRVPPGIVDGAQLRIPEQGHAGSHGAPAGDLYVHFQVSPHPVLRRDRDDLHMIVPVAVHEAALGVRIEVPSFDGPVRLRIPPGTQGAQRFRVSGRGVPRLRQGSGAPPEERGDLFIEVRLALPPMSDERSRELMRELARLHPADAVRRELVEQMGSAPDESIAGPVQSGHGTR